MLNLLRLGKRFENGLDRCLFDYYFFQFVASDLQKATQGSIFVPLRKGHYSMLVLLWVNPVHYALGFWLSLNLTTTWSNGAAPVYPSPPSSYPADFFGPATLRKIDEEPYRNQLLFWDHDKSPTNPISSSNERARDRNVLSVLLTRTRLSVASSNGWSISKPVSRFDTHTMRTGT